MLMGSSSSTCLLYAMPSIPFRRDLRPSIASYIATACKTEAEGPAGSGFGGRVAVLCVVARLDDRRERRHLLAVAQAHHDHTLRRPAHAADVVDGHANHGAAGRDQHHLVAVLDDARTGEMAAGLGQLDRLHAHAAAALARVVGHACALAVAVLGDHEQVGVVGGDRNGDHLVVTAQTHALHAG